MGMVVTATAGLSLWIILWAFGVLGFDAFLLTMGMLIVALIGRLVVPILPGNRDS